MCSPRRSCMYGIVVIIINSLPACPLACLPPRSSVRLTACLLVSRCNAAWEFVFYLENSRSFSSSNIPRVPSTSKKSAILRKNSLSNTKYSMKCSKHTRTVNIRHQRPLNASDRTKITHEFAVIVLKMSTSTNSHQFVKTIKRRNTHLNCKPNKTDTIALSRS